ncbi:hypothetical protein SVIOM74S_02599 [Streptomyces violarus]
MSRVWGDALRPSVSSSARTAAKKSRGIALMQRGQTYRAFQSRWMSMTQRHGGA